MRVRKRSRAALARLTVAVLVGAAVPLALPATDAAAATVTCTSNAHVFDVRSNGDLWLYDHTSPTTGAFTWTDIHQIGTGFTGTFLAGANGDIYRITGDGVMHLYNFADDAWTNTSGKAIGAGWQAFGGGSPQAFGPSRITVDSTGHIFAVNQTGFLYMFHYNDATGAWDDASGTEMDVGWNRYTQITAGGDGVLYAVDQSGTLFRYRYDSRSQRWTEYGRQIGTGFAGTIFSPGGDVLYLRDLNDLADRGLTYWYHYNDDTGTWDSDTGRLVAQGFDVNNHPQVTAGPDACAVPAPAPVPTVTPDPAPADAPITVADDDLLYPDQAGHVIVAESQAGSSQARTFQLGTMVTTAPISAVNSGGSFPFIAVLDDTGQVWFNDGEHSLVDFTSLGGYLKAVRLIPSDVPNGTIDLVGADAAGNLWVRQKVSDSHNLLPWRPDGVTIAPGTPNTDLPAVDSVTRAVGIDYGIGNTANGDAQLFQLGTLEPDKVPGTSTPLPVGNFEVLGVGQEVQNFPTVIGYDSTAGQAYFQAVIDTQDTWHPLPPLALADHKPVSVVGEFASFLLENAIGALGADGFVHVTNNYSGSDAAYGPWQQVSTQAAATAPTLVQHLASPVTLVFRGTDGQLYRYDALANTTQAPLSFTGGALQLSGPTLLLPTR